MKTKRTAAIEQFLRSLLFSIGMIIATIIDALITFCTFPFPFSVRYRSARLWSYFIAWWLKITCSISHQVKGLENLPKTGSAIVLSNHQSAWETAVFQVFLPPQVWVLKKELLNIPFFGWGLRLLDPIAIDRKAKRSAIEQIIMQGKQRLDTGRWVIIFPEGTRIAYGQRKPFTKGGATLAAKSGYPVVPIAHNAGRYWPRKSFLKNPGVITVMIGPIIESQGRTPSEINESAKAWIMQALEKLEVS